MLTLFLFLSAIFSFFTGSGLLIFICVTALVIKLYPLTTVLLAVLAAAYFAFNHWR